MSKLLELFASSRDMIYGESHPNRVNEVQDETAEWEMRPSSSKQPSASTMFSTSELACQDTPADLLADSETMETQPTSLSPKFFPTGGLQLEQICLNEEKRFPELAFVPGFTGGTKGPTLTVTQREVHQHLPFGYISRIHLIIKGNDCVG